MGFLEYARAVSLQKDELGTKILVNPKLQQPILTHDEAGFNIQLPVPSILDDETVSFLGFEFPPDSAKDITGRLFRACVLHLSSHTLIPNSLSYDPQMTSERTTAEIFSNTLVNDTYVNAYLAVLHSDKLHDLAFANSLSFAGMKPVHRIYNPATRIMVALLARMNIGIVKGTLRKEEEKAVNECFEELDLVKERAEKSLSRENKIDEDSVAADRISEILESHGPVLEAPSLIYTEHIGRYASFNQRKTPSEAEVCEVFKKSMETLGGVVPSDHSMSSYWKKESDSEATHAFESWRHQKIREEKMLRKLAPYIEGTKFKCVEFPDEDHTQYLRTKRLLSGGSRRLLDSLRVAQDALDEDPGKEMGQLDLTAVIQVLASRKPATDVFVQDEYLSRSFAWSILLDTSASMGIKGDLSRAIAICVAEATKELLMDASAWTLFAFSDRLQVLKDVTESYSLRVRARIGGLKFGGSTYMTDAIEVAGKILAQRFEEQRFLVVISDGWPYGYQDIDATLSETIDALKKRGVIVIGIGLETERMKKFFRLSSPVYDQKDLIKKFAKIYADASAAALET